MKNKIVLYLLCVLLLFSSAAFGEETLNLSFTDVTGEIVFDNSGYANHGTIRGGMITTAGKMGNALLLDGWDDYLDLSDTSFAIEDAFSIALWVKPEELPVTGNAVLLRRGTYINPFSLHMTPGGRIIFGVRTINGTKYLTSKTGLEAGEWYHLAASHTEGLMTLYVNGEEDKSREVSGSLVLNDPWREVTTALGTKPGVHIDFLKGIMDEVKIFNHTLEAFEIREIYAGEVSGITTPAPTATPVIPVMADLSIIQPVEGGFITSFPEGPVEAGTEVTFTFTPDVFEGFAWELKSWGNDLSGQTDNSITVLINSDITVSAILFNPAKDTITLVKKMVSHALSSKDYADSPQVNIDGSGSGSIEYTYSASGPGGGMATIVETINLYSGTPTLAEVKIFFDQFMDAKGNFLTSSHNPYLLLQVLDRQLIVLNGHLELTTNYGDSVIFSLAGIQILDGVYITGNYIINGQIVRYISLPWLD